MHKIEFFILVRRLPDNIVNVKTKSGVWSTNTNTAKKFKSLDKAWKFLGKEDGLAVGMYIDGQRYASGPEYAKGVK